MTTEKTPQDANEGTMGPSLSTAMLCGCGRTVRYMTKTGDACNKHMRCLTYDERGEALKQANLHLLNLLALIHRDILELAHREAWRYKKSSDPHHSDTYTFNRSTMLEFARKLIAEEREACATLLENNCNGFGDESITRLILETNAAAIRARSNVELTGSGQVHRPESSEQSERG